MITARLGNKMKGSNFKSFNIQTSPTFQSTFASVVVQNNQLSDYGKIRFTSFPSLLYFS